MLRCEIISRAAAQARSRPGSPEPGRSLPTAPITRAPKGKLMATLTIASKNYGSWSLRGWLLCKMAGLDFKAQQTASDDPSTRAELLLLSPSFLVPCLTHDGVQIWDTLAIAEYLNELNPTAGLMPKKRADRARCRSI